MPGRQHPDYDVVDDSIPVPVDPEDFGPGVELDSTTDIRIWMLLDLAWLIGWLEGKGIDPPPFIHDNYLHYKDKLLGGTDG